MRCLLQGNGLQWLARWSPTQIILTTIVCFSPLEITLYLFIYVYLQRKGESLYTGWDSYVVCLKWIPPHTREDWILLLCGLSLSHIVVFYFSISTKIFISKLLQEFISTFFLIQLYTGFLYIYNCVPFWIQTFIQNIPLLWLSVLINIYDGLLFTVTFGGA